MEVLQLDREAAEEFCRLRMDLFRELGELCPGTDVPGLERATERYYLEHIGKDLFAWGIFSGGEAAGCGGALLVFAAPICGKFCRCGGVFAQRLYGSGVPAAGVCRGDSGPGACVQPGAGAPAGVAQQQRPGAGSLRFPGISSQGRGDGADSGMKNAAWYRPGGVGCYLLSGSSGWGSSTPNSWPRNSSWDCWASIWDWRASDRKSVV